jgi:DNA invertase Pin-like site-specific DNA recombinase
VLTHQERRRRPYARRQRAPELGGPPARIAVSAPERGLTAATAPARVGFQDLVAQLTHAEVGLILSGAVTRLARNCSDWYPRRDLGGCTGGLIADRDGVSDPARTNGRWVLGLQGPISEVERDTRRARLTAGWWQTAHRGDLAVPLPGGVVRDERGAVPKDPNRAVQQRLLVVCSTFLEGRAASQVARGRNARGLARPRRDRFGEVACRAPTHLPRRAVVASLRKSGRCGGLRLRPAGGGPPRSHAPPSPPAAPPHRRLARVAARPVLGRHRLGHR